MSPAGPLQSKTGQSCERGYRPHGPLAPGRPLCRCRQASPLGQDCRRLQPVQKSFLVKTGQRQRPLHRKILISCYVSKTSSPEIQNALNILSVVRVFKYLVRRQSFLDFACRLITEALVQFLFELTRRQLGAATGVFRLSAS